MGAAKPKVVIISPYFSILGGGERYILTIGEILLQKMYPVTALNLTSSLVSQAENKFHLKLSGLQLVKVKKRLFFNLLQNDFDTLFTVTDGSLFFSPIRNSFLIIQSPDHIPKNTYINQVKLSRFKNILCYSDFIRKLILQKLKRQAEVLHPPIDTTSLKPLTKTNTILSVGRFFTNLHSKKQHVLIEEFVKMVNVNALTGWKLQLVGSIDQGGEEYIKELKTKSQGYPIDIIINPPFAELKKLYGSAKIYWHAAGKDEDLTEYPAKAEHFGISIVESMSSGCVPLAFNAGGPKEIITSGLNGYLYSSSEELVEKTIKLAQDNYLRQKLAQRAITDSKNYSKEKFFSNIENLLSH